jgi:hypothetical protein
LLQKSLKVPIKKSNIKMLFGLTILYIVSIVSMTIGAPQTPAPKANINATQTPAVLRNSTIAIGRCMALMFLPECGYNGTEY